MGSESRDSRPGSMDDCAIACVAWSCAVCLWSWWRSSAGVGLLMVVVVGEAVAWEMSGGWFGGCHVVISLLCHGYSASVNFRSIMAPFLPLHF